MKILKTVFDLGLDALLFMGSYVVPKRRGLWVCGADLGTAFKGNPKYVYQYLLREGRGVNAHWVTGSRAVYRRLQARGWPVSYKYSFQCFLKLLRAEFLFIDFTPKDVFYLGETALGRFRFIMTSHGMPLKKGGQLALEEGRGRQFTYNFCWINSLLRWLKVHFIYKVLLKDYAVCLATSEESRRDLKVLFQNENVEVLGAPRNDVLYDDTFAFEDYLASLQLASYSKVYLYAPTFRDFYEKVVPFSKDFLVRFERWLEAHNAILLVKKHPLDKRIELAADLQRIRDVSLQVDDIMELFPHTDVLITDYSSVFFDYPLLNKPVLYYPYDYDGYLRNCRGMIYDYWTTLPGPFARSEEELITLLGTADEWFSNAGYREKYDAFRDRFNTYQDGHSSQRVVEYLMSELR